MLHRRLSVGDPSFSLECSFQLLKMYMVNRCTLRINEKNHMKIAKHHVLFSYVNLKKKKKSSASELLFILVLPLQGDNPSVKTKSRATFNTNSLIQMSI